MSINKIHNKKYILLFAVTSFFLLTFSSMTSFLFPIHNWVDQNCFLTVGKGMTNGLVPYHDLFEQKGILLYVIHALAALLSSNSFIGVFFIQVIFFTFFMCILYKISELYLSKQLSIYVSIFTSIIIVTAHCYRRGDNAEEFCLPFLALSLYFMLKGFKEDFQTVFSYKTLLVNGFIAGCVLWIKFSLLGFHIGFILTFFIVSVIGENYKKSIIGCLVFLLGMIICTIPFFLYFLINNSLYEWFDVYFYSNIFLYSKDMTILERGWYMIKSAGINIARNPIITIFTWIGIINFCFKKNNVYIKEKLYKIMLFIGMVTLFGGVYIGGTSYSYYLLITTFLSVLGIIVFVNKIQTSWVTNKKFIPLISVLCCTVTILFSNCFYYYGKTTEDFAQYKFAKIINAVPNATLLNYGFLDGGFYLTSNTEPPSRYFCIVNIPKKNLPEMYEEQNYLVENQVTDFIVARTRYNKKAKVYPNLKNRFLLSHYTIIATGLEEHDGYKYFLLKRY